VIRPKSIATVVVDFDSTPDVSSTPMLSSVRYSSVSSGWISLTAPTRVVLPTPKPPAIRILRATGSASSSTAESDVDATPCSEGPKAIEYRLEYAFGRKLCRRYGGARANVTTIEQVAEEYPDRTGWEIEVGGQLGHRDGTLTQPNDR
jgi:hypothetical protein